ncbi:MAG: aminoacyl-tRNA hydrolase [Candidatus Saccharimonadales bacterium]
MALFQKKPQVSDNIPLYTLSLSKTLLLVGLGNPGKEYDLTRHNIGFNVVDYFVETQEMSAWVKKKDLKCIESSGTLGNVRVLAIKPTTFMNNSGEAVQAVMHFYKIPISQTVVIYDELDINFGNIRTRIGGSSAGHNGVSSIINEIGDNFGRVRIGIANDQSSTLDGAKFVLSKFNKKETSLLNSLKKETASLLTEYIYGDNLPVQTRSFIV